MGNTSRDLNNYRSSGTYFTIYAARAINNNMVIVGWGTDINGQYRGFVLQP